MSILNVCKAKTSQYDTHNHNTFLHLYVFHLSAQRNHSLKYVHSISLLRFVPKKTQQTEFEVSVCELICRKDMGKLIKSTILTRLTQGLEIVAMWNHNIDVNDEGEQNASSAKTHVLFTHTLSTYMFLVIWHYKPWPWGKSQCQNGGACCARSQGANSSMIRARCGQWMI